MKKMEQNTSINDGIITITAEELLKSYKENSDAVKKKYEGKVIVVKGNITKSSSGGNLFDKIVLNKKINCSIEIAPKELSIREVFKNEEVRYSAKANRNISVKGKLTIGLIGGLNMEKCILSYDGENPLVQDIENAYKKTCTKVKWSSCFALASILFYVVGIIIPFVLGMEFNSLILGSFSALFALVLCFSAWGIGKNDFFDSIASANTLASGVKGISILNHLGNGLRLFGWKLVSRENYKVSVSRENWENVKLNKTTKKYIAKNALLGRSFLGVVFQGFILMSSIVLYFTLCTVCPFVLSGFERFTETQCDLLINAIVGYASIIFILLDAPLILRRNSLFLKYAKEVTENQKKWTKIN